MARPLRIEFPSAVYHVTSRGNGRAAIYLDDGDREAFLKVLGEVCRRMRWLCYSYCLMTNHYHLVIETLDNTLSKGMRQLNGVYTQCFNRHHGRVGHVFQGRYKAILVDREPYLLELVRYVVLNPIRANMVTSPEQWRWSSYHATAGASPYAGLARNRVGATSVWDEADPCARTFCPIRPRWPDPAEHLGRTPEPDLLR